MEEPRGVIRLQKSNFLEVVKKRVKSQRMSLGKACFSVEDSRTREELGQTTRSNWRTVQFLEEWGMELVSFLYEAFHQQFRELPALQGRPTGISLQPTSDLGSDVSLRKGQLPGVCLCCVYVCLRAHTYHVLMHVITSCFIWIEMTFCWSIGILSNSEGFHSHS